MNAVREAKRVPFRILETRKYGRVYLNATEVGGCVRCPKDVVKLVADIYKDELREVTLGLYCNTKNKVLRVHVVSIGTLNASLMHPREILRPAIRFAAASVLLVHNHPTGDPTPSREDIEFTRRFAKACELVGIELMDHIVIGDADRFISLKESGHF